MAYREIKPEEIDIFEPRGLPVKQKKKFSLDSIQVSTKELWDLCLWSGIGLLLIYIGATNAGSYYMPGTRMAGTLAVFFYQWQIGTVSIAAGCILIYHKLAGLLKR